jgi:hypothetical protein
LPIFGDFCRFSAIFANFRRKKQYYSQFKKTSSSLSKNAKREKYTT